MMTIDEDLQFFQADFSFMLVFAEIWIFDSFEYDYNF